MGACASALGVPNIDIDVAAIGETVKEKGPELKKAYEEQYGTYKHDLKTKRVDEKDKGIVLEQNAPDKEVKKAALKVVGQGAFKDQVKDQVWQQLEGKLSEQLPADAPEMVKNKALGVAHKKVDDVVDKALDKMIEEYYKKIDAGEA